MDNILDIAARLVALRKPKLNIYQDANKKWRWQVHASSDEIAASTQGYANRTDCVDNLRKLSAYILELEREGKII